MTRRNTTGISLRTAADKLAKWRRRLAPGYSAEQMLFFEELGLIISNMRRRAEFEKAADRH